MQLGQKHLLHVNVTGVEAWGRGGGGHTQALAIEWADLTPPSPFY